MGGEAVSPGSPLLDRAACPRLNFVPLGVLLSEALGPSHWLPSRSLWASVSAQALTSEIAITANQPAVDDAFGLSLEMRGSIGAVGAPDATQWQLVKERNAAQPQASLFFGQTLTQFGGQILVVAMGRRSNQPITGAGAMYVFERQNGTWTERQKFQLSPGVADSYFGHDMGAAANRVALGTFRNNLGTPLEGRAYIRKEDGAGSWALENTLSPRTSDEKNDALGFGSSVGLSDNDAWVGVPYGETATSAIPKQTGKVAVFMLDSAATPAPVMPLGALAVGVGLGVLVDATKTSSPRSP